MESATAYRIGKPLHAFVEEEVSSGRYGDADEVVRAGLLLLQRREERLSNLRKAIAEGDADLVAGRVHEYGSADEMLADIMSDED